MRLRPLADLVAAARSLPAGGSAPESGERATASAEVLPDSTPVEVANASGAEGSSGRSPGHSIDPRELRRAIGALTTTLGERIAEVLPEALARADRAWDQIDSVTLLDPAIAREASVLRARAEALRATGDARTRAAGREAQLFLDQAIALTSLVERRLATLVRLRLRTGAPLLDQRGQPFLDLGAALVAAGRAWA